MQALLIRRRIIFALIVAIILAAVWWSYSRAIINVNAGQGSATYVLSDTNGNDSTTTKNGDLSRIVSTGQYTIRVNRGNQNYFAVIKTGHWLSRSRLSANLTPEKKRTYIGDNPAACMVFTSVLYSYDCGGAYSSISLHVPANSTIPTYTAQIGTGKIEGSVEGFIDTSQGHLLLAHPGDIEGPGPHIIYQVDDNLSPTQRTVLQNLNDSGTYSITNYKDGFLIYKSDFSQIFYYASTQAKPVNISLNVQSGGLQPTSLAVNQKHITAVYSQPSANNQAVNNKIADYSDGAVKTLSISDTPISSAVWCATGRICAISGQKFNIYDIDNGQRLYSITANAISPSPGGILVATDKEVLDFNATSFQATVDYTYGAYGYCGLQPVNTSRYLLCLKSGDKKVALLIDQASPDTDSIDKKIQRLSQLKEVDAISVYGQYIYISPQTGDPVYDPAKKIYVANPAKLQQAVSKINQTADSLGINRQKYQIIITG